MALVYSCCFWFSLRLGGILIALFSVLQATGGMIAFCLAHTHVRDVKDEMTYWMTNMNLIYLKSYLENVKEEPEKYTTFGIVSTSIYIATCILYAYGAYTFNNTLMIGYILAEFMRLIALSILMATFLLVLKSNTMDIGTLIGTSVGVGFFLLGMFYLWVCAANLPILINEMKHDEQVATIARLQRLLEQTNTNFEKPAYDISISKAYNNKIVALPTDDYNRGGPYRSRLPLILKNRERTIIKPCHNMK